ncbi:RNA polymerase sigma factor [Nonomuraea roseoviolacea]|uniref:RNA polymerase sigma factor (Sigma-70 family) n=1 Tax=Nonomuraea roseoviolacea subsp. carminata TaxID=160689 RepID=A0ABT1JXY8_9ACTN|nr:sigma-70 family RNA polymerase sigma factor [Nonomuraea roseoviolacea]MCP2346616.1 RNA polymerase sigma factor (sigma-70 family) [Nonomuraea roseoviolacea subsp. carminata]
MADRAWASAQLIEAAQAGDRESIAAVLYGAHTHVRRLAEHLCASPQDAEDAAQEALIILYRKIGSLRATGALASWMFRIVRNECLRRARLVFERQDERLLFEHQDEARSGLVSSAEDEAIRRLEAELVARAIQELPEVQRRVLIMRDVLGYPGPSVARSLGLSNAAMKSQLHRARNRLRLGLAGGGMSGPAEGPRDPASA